jgi:hypothetical protein
VTIALFRSAGVFVAKRRQASGIDLPAGVIKSKSV